MKVYFLRHGETPAVEQGLIQGSSDFPELNQLNLNGIEQVKNSAISLIPKIKNSKGVYVVQGNQWRVVQSTEVLMGEISKYFDSSEVFVTTDVALKGRSYGKLEGLNEAELRRKRNLVTVLFPAIRKTSGHCTKIWSLPQPNSISSFVPIWTSPSPKTKSARSSVSPVPCVETGRVLPLSTSLMCLPKRAARCFSSTLTCEFLP